MPCVGLIDDGGACITWAEIKNGMGDFSDPRSLLLSLFQDREKYCDFSVTELLDDPRAVQLKRRYDYYQKPDDMTDMMLGSALHSHLMLHVPKDDPNLIAECKLTEAVEVRLLNPKETVTVWIGGTFDFVDGDTLWDYKQVTMGKMMKLKSGSVGITDYEDQVNFYHAMMPEPLQARVTKAFIKFVVRDWRFYEFKKMLFDPDKYPRGRVLPIKLKEVSKVKEQMATLVKQHAAAVRLEESGLPPCDNWGGLRCEHYCAVSSVCSVYNNKQKETDK